MSPLSEESSFEELDGPRPTRVPMRILLVVLALAVGAVVVVRAVGSASSGKPVAVPTMDRTAPLLPVRAPMPSAERPAVDPSGNTLFVPYHPPRPCPPANDGQNACSTYRRVSATFLQAVRERYPRIVVRTAVTRILRGSGRGVRPGLWSVEFVGTAGRTRLRIAIERAEDVDKASVTTTSGVARSGIGFEFFRYVIGRYAVELEARGIQASTLSDVLPTARLARDRRLLLAPAATMNR